jgi:hypothetical protein
MATVADAVAAKLKASFEVRVSCRVARNLLACMYIKEKESSGYQSSIEA